MTVGIVAGLGAVVFYQTLRVATYVFLQVIVGYRVPQPIREAAGAASAPFAGPWAIPLDARGEMLLGEILTLSFLHCGNVNANGG